MNGMLDKINSNGGYRENQIINDQYNYDELMGILEYGDHRSIYQDEYSHEPIFYTERNGNIITSTGILPDKYDKIGEDLDLAKRLGGYRMQSSVIYNLDKRSRKRDNKRKIVIDILNSYPDKYRSAIKFIIKYDLNKLINFTIDMYKQKLKRVIFLLVENRARDFGIIISGRDLRRTMKIRSLGIKLTNEMRLAGFFIKEIKIIDIIKISAMNILFKMKENDIISDNELDHATILLRDIDTKFTQIMNSRLHIDIVIAIMIVRLIRKQLKIIPLLEKCQFLIHDKKHYYSLYQAIKRADLRCYELSHV